MSHRLRLMQVLVWYFLVPVSALAQDNWSGQAQCQLAVQSQGFVHQEIQAWTLTGAAPTLQGAMQIYPATWSVSGQGGAQRPQGTQVMAAQWNNNVPGLNAPIAIFVRASDGRLVIKLWHSQLSVFGGTNSVRQVGTSQTSTAYTVFEWSFPMIDDAATSTNVSGTGTVQVTANSIPIPSANSTGVATCKWQFIKGAQTAPMRVAATPNLMTQATANAASPVTSVPQNISNLGSPTQIARTPVATALSNDGTSNSSPSVDANAGPAVYAVPNGAGANSSSSSSGQMALQTPNQIASMGAMNTGGNALVSSASSTPASSSAQTSLSNTHASLSAAAATPVALPAPAAFTAKNMGNGSVQLTWQAVSGAIKYRLQGTGIPTSGLDVSLPASSSSISQRVALKEASGATIQNVPPGFGNWQIAALDLHNIPSTQSATASVVVRYPPPHSAAWLSKNNGAGSAALAQTHYMAACPGCVPGATFGTVAVALGLPQNLVQGNCDGGYSNCSPALTSYDDYGQQWNPEALYSNVTEFGTTRTAVCWNVSIPATSPGLPPRVLCYSNSGNHGLTVIAKDQQYAYFMTFTSPGPNASVFDYKLSTDVTFDSEGPKHAPHACLSCHGGTWNAGRVTGATLLPLDPGILQVTDNGRFNALNFLQVNQAVMSSAPSPAVARYLTGLYNGDPRQIARQYPLDTGSILWTTLSGGAYAGAPWPATDFVPAGWKQQADFYKAAIKPYCMMCHLATPSNLDFSTFGSFTQNKALIQAEVCSGHTMPHAEYPYKQFWTKDTGNIFLPGYLVGEAGITTCQ